MSKTKKTKPSQKNRTRFEIGLTYSRLGVYFLAISSESLITHHRDTWIITTPKELSQFKAMTQTQVDDLRSMWNISREEMDSMSKKYVVGPRMRKVRPGDSKPSYRTAQRRKAEELATQGPEKSSGRLVKCHYPKGVSLEG